MQEKKDIFYSRAPESVNLGNSFSGYFMFLISKQSVHGNHCKDSFLDFLHNNQLK